MAFWRPLLAVCRCPSPAALPSCVLGTGGASCCSGSNSSGLAWLFLSVFFTNRRCDERSSRGVAGCGFARVCVSTGALLWVEEAAGAEAAELRPGAGHQLPALTPGTQRTRSWCGEEGRSYRVVLSLFTTLFPSCTPTPLLLF